MCRKTNRNDISCLITEHYRSYPLLQIGDLLKFIYQGAFGCEHMVSDEAVASEHVRREYSADNTECFAPERLSAGYSRVPLSYIKAGLSPETLGRLFYLSAKNEPCGTEHLLFAIDALTELTENGDLPFKNEDVRSAVFKWKAEGYPSLHHTAAFRREYRPSYRVIANEYVRFLPLFIAIDKLLSEVNRRVIVAIEGGSASGKTTLAAMLEKVYGCTVFHMDDFFLRPEQRTAARFAELGGNVDRERFLSEVLIPISEGKPVCYRPFDCSRQMLGEPVTATLGRLMVVEGAYSMHPQLAKYYDISIFLDISEEFQRERIKKRNSPEHAKRFFEEWIPLENKYFHGLNIRNKCDISMAVDEEF